MSEGISSWLDSQWAALSVSYNVHNQYSDPAEQCYPSRNDWQCKWNGCVDSVVSSSFKWQVFVKVIHKIKNSSAWESRLQNSDLKRVNILFKCKIMNFWDQITYHLPSCMDIFNYSIAILLTGAQISISQHYRMNQTVRRRNFKR